MATRIPALLSPPLAFAHRGARAHARDNTLEAFALAHRLGASGIETDAWRSADGKIVLDHDGIVRRLLIFRRPISGIDSDQLPGHIPTLSEYYEYCGASLPLSIDVKDPLVFDDVVAVARSYDASSRLWVCHDDLAVLSSWRDAAPEVRLVNSVRLQNIVGGTERRAADLARLRIDAINMRCPDWNGGLTTLFHRFDVLAFGWDAQHERNIAELVDMGIDAVYSDHVDRMVDVIDRMTGPAVEET